MFGEHHTLPSEFPEHIELINQLVANNTDFKNMAEQYNALDEEIIQIEQNVEPVSDNYAEDLKKKRVVLKDKIYDVLQQHQT